MLETETPGARQLYNRKKGETNAKENRCTTPVIRRAVTSSQSHAHWPMIRLISNNVVKTTTEFEGGGAGIIQKVSQGDISTKIKLTRRNLRELLEGPRQLMCRRIRSRLQTDPECFQK